MRKYRVSWKAGRKAGALGVFCPGSITVEAEDPEAARLKAYDTHEHLQGVTVVRVSHDLEPAGRGSRVSQPCRYPRAMYGRGNYREDK